MIYLVITTINNFLPLDIYYPKSIKILFSVFIPKDSSVCFFNSSEPGFKTVNFGIYTIRNDSFSVVIQDAPLSSVTLCNNSVV